MGYLGSCGLCCAGISIWGVIQLVVLGILFSREATSFVEESLEHDMHNAVDYDSFIPRLQEGYKEVSSNCFAAAGMYAVSLIVSLFCVWQAKQTEAKLALSNLDECEERKDTVY